MREEAVLVGDRVHISGMGFGRVIALPRGRAHGTIGVVVRLEKNGQEVEVSPREISRARGERSEA